MKNFKCYMMYTPPAPTNQISAFVTIIRGSFRKFVDGQAIATYREIRRGDGLLWDENLTADVLGG